MPEMRIKTTIRRAFYLLSVVEQVFGGAGSFQADAHGGNNGEGEKETIHLAFDELIFLLELIVLGGEERRMGMESNG